MLIINKVAALLIGAVVLSAATTMAAVPNLINYQGQLTDSTGAPLDTIVDITFTIYDVGDGGGSIIFQEDHAAVVVSGGLISVLLGSVQPLDATVFEFEETFLGIQVGSDPEITPLIQMVSVPYAYRVSTIDGATGGTVTGDVRIESGDLTVLGNVGIGNISPVYTLDINGGASLLRLTGGGVSFQKLTVDVATGGYTILDVFDKDNIEDFHFSTAPGDDSWLNGPGNVGVGTTGPTEKLQVAGTVHSMLGGFKFPDNTVQTTAASGVVDGDWTIMGNDMFSAVSGNVGINNSAPTSRFHMDGTFRIDGGGTTFPKLTLDYGTGGFSRMRIYGSTSVDVFRFSTVSGEDSYLTGPGNVGIGTKTPTEKLQVSGTIHSTSGGIKFPDNTVQTTAAVNDGDWTISGNNVFATLPGNVGINNSAPTSRLHMDGTFRIDGGGTSFPKLTFDYATGGFSRMRIYGSTSQDVFRFSTVSGETSYLTGPGNVGIGTKTPSQKLQVAGTIYSSSGGFRFPDNTVQTTAATSAPASIESGVAQQLTGGTITLTGPVQVLETASLTSPASGFVLVMVSCDVRLIHSFGTPSRAIFGVSTSSGSFGNADADKSVELPSSLATGTYVQTVSAQKIFSVGPGAKTYFFLGDRQAGNTQVVGDITLSLVYFPTSYGTFAQSSTNGPDEK